MEVGQGEDGDGRDDVDEGQEEEREASDDQGDVIGDDGRVNEGTNVGFADVGEDCEKTTKTPACGFVQKAQTADVDTAGAHSTGIKDGEMDGENHTATSGGRESEEKVVEDFFNLFFVDKDDHIGFSLKQVTCTIEDAV